jgi:hypothetical protein
MGETATVRRCMTERISRFDDEKVNESSPSGRSACAHRTLSLADRNVC